VSKYTIILPVKNGGEYVKDCINSILAQTLSDFNLIVLDNCSTDGTLYWIKSIVDERIIIHATFLPLSMEDNWGRIKDIEKNEFMTIIGHDDILHPNYLQVMDELIKKHSHASLYQAHFRYIDSNGDFIRNCLPMAEVQYIHEFLACHFSKTMDSMGTGYMMRSKDYNALGGIPIAYPNLIFADYELWSRLMLNDYKATTVEECFSYRIHNSTSRLTNGMQYQDAFEKYIQFLNSITYHPKVRMVIDRYGREMLLYYCESLSHRVLKTPWKDRNLTVAQFIDKCKQYANDLIPGQDFDPLSNFRISIARTFDKNIFGRTVFNVLRKLR
jgi:glycosyltransferase involved in cell wall biosynthesis